MEVIHIPSDLKAKTQPKAQAKPQPNAQCKPQINKHLLNITADKQIMENQIVG